MQSNIHASALPLGFTLIELMVAVAIISILAVIAVPNYADYVKRSRIVDATSRLSDFRVRMEQYFLDNRKYSADTGQCGVPDPTPTGAESFKVQCNLNDDRSYTVTATGLAAKGMQDFAYQIDQDGNKRTASLPAGWATDNQATCWITRKDGSCG